MSNGQSRPTRWWQWVLMYPTLILTLIGSAPTVYQLYGSFKFNIPFGMVFYANKQNELWEKNAEYLNQEAFEGVTTSENFMVKTLVCPTGDVLVKLISPQDKKIYFWVGVDMLKKKAIVKLFSSEAFASPSVIAQVNATVICQRWVGPGLLLLRVRYPNGQCYDEIINTHNGAVISRTPAPCDGDC